MRPGPGYIILPSAAADKSFRWESITFSLILHVAVLAVIYAPATHKRIEPPQYIAVSFGDGSGGAGSSGGSGGFTQAPSLQPQTAEPKQSSSILTTGMPATPSPAVQRSEDGILPGGNQVSGLTQSTGTAATGAGFSGDGTGFGSGSGSGFGYSIDWGGQGQRRILSYSLPEYPSGVNKEVDIRVRFTILPDGAVGSALILNKADTRLESAAVNSLRRWRFEPLRASQEQSQQIAVISFPYRLR